jgi:hypothetical protein
MLLSLLLLHAYSNTVAHAGKTMAKATAVQQTTRCSTTVTTRPVTP